MERTSSRRKILQTTGAALAAGLAGCASSGGSSSSTNDSGATANETATGTSTATPMPANSVDSEVLSDFESTAEWELTTEGSLESTADSYMGQNAAKLTRDRVEPVITRNVDIDLKKRNLSLAVKTDTSSTAVVDLIANAPDEENQVVLGEGIRSSMGQAWMRIDPGVVDVSGIPDLSKVTQLSIRIRGGGDDATVLLDDLRLLPSPEKPRVVMTFDDSLASTHSAAFQHMSEFDMPGMVATITGEVGDDGRLSLDQMKEMQKADWEFASHTTSHADLENADRLQVEQEVVAAKEWLVENGFETGAQWIAYPYGKVNPAVLNFIEKHHDMGFRYIGTNSAGSGYVTQPITTSRGAGHNIERAQRIVDLSKLYNDVEIFAFHGVGTDDNLSVTESEFRSFLEHVDGSEAEVVPMSTIANEMVAPISPDE